jgi:hypothetical protein
MGCLRPLRPGDSFCAYCGPSSGVPTFQIASPALPAASGRFAANWSEFKRVGWLFGSLLSCSLVLGLVARSGNNAWPIAIATAVDALLAVGFAITRFEDIRPLLYWPWADATRLWQAVAVVVAFFVLMPSYFAMLRHFGAPFARLSAPFLSAHWPIWSIYALISLAPAIFEELAFRGVIQSALARLIQPREAWLIQAALFSILHLSPVIFPSHFVMGLCLGFLRWRLKSLYPGMLLHASWNALVIHQELLVL